MILSRLWHLLSTFIPLEQRIGLKDNLNILDVGCGTGQELKQLHAQNLLRVGVDLNKAKLKGKHSQIHCVLADACYLPFKPRIFDIVMSRQFVSHVWNLHGSFREMERVCNSVVYVEDSNFLNPIVSTELIIRLGFSWLWRKGQFARVSKLEDVHSIFWWKRLMKKPIVILTRRRFHNLIVNALWKYFGPDCIFTYRICKPYS